MMWPLVLLAVVAAAVFAAKNRAPGQVPDIVIPGINVPPPPGTVPFLDVSTLVPPVAHGVAYADGRWSVDLGGQVLASGTAASSAAATTMMLNAFAPQGGRDSVSGSYQTERGEVQFAVQDESGGPPMNGHYVWQTSEGLDGDAGTNRYAALRDAVQAARLGPVQQAQTGGP